MRKYTKIISLMLVIMLIMSISTSVFAQPPDGFTGNRGDTSSIVNIGQRIIGIVQVVGSLAAVAVLVVLGIKYMIGSAEEKAEYKKTMLPYFIGAILIFAATNIASMVFKWASTITA